MPITNPWSITYGDVTVGGESASFQINGPYSISKTFTTVQLSFTVIVVAEDYESLQARSDELETAFSKRDEDFSIDLDGSTWTYTFGTDALNTTATISKPGTAEVDRGVARAYTCTIDAELPADDQDGLRDLRVRVNYTPSRQRIVTMTGTYTAQSGGTARDTYINGFDSEATTILSGLDGSATFELVNENHEEDRNNHVCSFSRDYVELLEDQLQGTRDANQIRDHRIAFTELFSSPGDSRAGVYRLRRVLADFSCAIDIEQTTDVKETYDSSVKEHLKQLFQSNFDPQIFAIEDERITYDETSKRLNAAVTFLYQKGGGNAMVEVSQSLTYREARNIDYTPVHGGDELDMYADNGWATIQRVWERTVVAIGNERPSFRIAGNPSFLVAGDFGQAVAGASDVLSTSSNIRSSGWNVISNESKVTDQWIGDPSDTQMKLFVLTETVVEQFSRAPSGTASGGGLGAGGTPFGGAFGGGTGAGRRGSTSYFGFGIPGVRSGVGVLPGRRDPRFGFGHRNGIR